jgi:hypothetical protein
MYDRIALHDFLLLLMVMLANVWERKMAIPTGRYALPTDQYAVNEKIGGPPARSWHEPLRAKMDRPLKVGVDVKKRVSACLIAR